MLFHASGSPAVLVILDASASSVLLCRMEVNRRLDGSNGTDAAWPINSDGPRSGRRVILARILRPYKFAI